MKGLTGIDKVMRNLNNELRRMKNKSLRGMIEAAAIVRRDMDRTPPLIPVDTGNLRASWYVTSGYSGFDPVVTMGFSASYALFVHEMEGKIAKRPNAGPKFFESSLIRNRGRMLEAIAKHIQV